MTGMIAGSAGCRPGGQAPAPRTAERKTGGPAGQDVFPGTWHGRTENRAALMPAAKGKICARPGLAQREHGRVAGPPRGILASREGQPPGSASLTNVIHMSMNRCLV